MKLTKQSIITLLKDRILPIGFLVFLIITICVSWINYRMDRSTNEYMLSFEEVAGSFDAVIVLGAKVYANGALGGIVRDRADMAIRLYKTGKVKKILVSADNGTANYNETKAIYQYLIDNQIPKIDIFLDFAGFDTYDSMYRAKNNFQVETLLIPNHLNYCAWSVYISRSLGIDAYCVTMAKLTSLRTISGLDREKLATIKARLNIKFSSKAYFATDDLYPISGPGNAGDFY